MAGAVWAKGKAGGEEGREVTGAGAVEMGSHCEHGARRGPWAGEGQKVTQDFKGSLWPP